ncbi:hypothetical protein JOF53_004876 [Crossiella equi]|uniref:Uncharacterized protein n=1 Tax=Crossiella equi TaxID=130796 RepID=A0ABS5AIG9_9PSEU|nr:hypothetical protein [Crossiella equi]MBP2476004.1 hypothetical protein [Crossiella equi]
MDKSWPSPVFDTAVPMGAPPAPKKRKGVLVGLIVACSLLAVSTLGFGAALLGTYNSLVSSRASADAGKRALADSQRRLEQARTDVAEAERRLLESRETGTAGQLCKSTAELARELHKAGDKKTLAEMLDLLPRIC